MECNKDEAIRAKEIAEKKFNVKDIAGAKKFAIKAQALYPGLEGIAQMLATFDVYLCAENRTNGEADWYGILGVAHSADDETVRKQYRKLALTLHPDKNKSVGAEGAFKFISAAWSLLSDKSKRAAYDQRLSPRVFERKATAPDQGQQAPRGANGFYDFVETAFSGRRVNENTSQGNTSYASHAAQKVKPNTFWTICPKCKMQYEYLRVYVNHNLICQNCRQTFFAIETPPPSCSNGSKTSVDSSQQQRNPNTESGSKARTAKTGSGGSNGASGAADFQWAPFSRGRTSNVAHAASVVQQTYEKVKREREEALAAKRQEKAMKRKYRSAECAPGDSSTDHFNFTRKKRGTEKVGSSRSNQSFPGTRGDTIVTTTLKHGNSETIQIKGTSKLYNRRLLSQTEISDILMQKARAGICKWKSQCKSDSPLDNVSPKENFGEKVHNEKGRKNSVGCDQKEVQVSVDRKSIDTSNLSPTEHGKKTFESLSISVPDPDFYDFDKNRTERAFEENQVWAAYDDDDGMPRYYAIIHALLSRDPFKVQIGWLNSKMNTELGSLNWLGSGFSKTCGDFRVGRYEISCSLNSFSHKVMWTKGARGVIHIFPRKGDVWALYRNWSPDWNELISDDIVHEYDMVEVLADYEEQLGVFVTPLVKVAGFKTVFRQHLDHNKVQRIPREEMFRFSHQVPCHLLTSQEAPDTLKGCVELDPAATPMDLLHVIADIKEDVGEDEADVGNSESKVHDKDLKQNIAEKHEVSGNPNKEKVVEVVEIE